jgi:hypothetical protein
MHKGLTNWAANHVPRLVYYIICVVFVVFLLALCFETSRRGFSRRYSNHWGLDTFLLACICIVPILWSLIGLGLHPRPWRAIIILGILACVTMAGLLIFDQYNVLVKYDTWLDRGMPQKWTRAG